MIKSIATVDGADVGKFENLVLDKTPVSTAVTDEPGSGTPGAGNEGDLVKVTITADQVSVAENVKPTFTVHINTALAHDCPGPRPGRDLEQQRHRHHQSG
ncbi:hypothetical protein [Pseudomonas sp. NGC7]|uniref:hypothetical protein n=1 Tax=Pseudomonas sp. NGC7 TaxID=3341775 RepID=UPI00399D1E24